MLNQAAMKNVLLFLMLLTLFWGCGKKSIDPYAPSVNPAGEWTKEKGGAGGFDNYESYKNFQYTFEVATDGQKVSIQLNSPDINLQYVLIDDTYNLPIEKSSISQKISNEYTLDAGTYRLVVMADRQATGRFALALKGTKQGATLLPSTSLQASATFGSLGGGGQNVSFKNHFYTVDVTEPFSSYDIEVQSADTELMVYTYNPYGPTNAQFSSTRKGKYTYEIKSTTNTGPQLFMVTTAERGSMGSYDLRVTGQVDKLTRVESQSMVVTGQWSASSKVDQMKLAYDEYTLDLTDDGPNPLDVEITSADTFVELYLQSSNGSYVSYSNQSSSQNKTFKVVPSSLVKGKYKIIARTSASAKGQYGTYTLNVFGRFSSFKKTE